MRYTRQARIITMLTLLSCVFVAEIALGTTLQSLVILTDSVHLLSDILALIVALYAIRISKHPETDMLTYGWKRAEILAAFFNGIFLVALSVSIIIHSIQRFIHLEEVSEPLLVIIIGCVGLGTNVAGIFIFHEHPHLDGDHSACAHLHHHDHDHAHGHDHQHHDHEHHHHGDAELGHVKKQIHTQDHRQEAPKSHDRHHHHHHHCEEHSKGHHGHSHHRHGHAHGHDHPHGLDNPHGHDHTHRQKHHDHKHSHGNNYSHGHDTHTQSHGHHDCAHSHDHDHHRQSSSRLDSKHDPSKPHSHAHFAPGYHSKNSKLHPIDKSSRHRHERVEEMQLERIHPAGCFGHTRRHPDSRAFNDHHAHHPHQSACCSPTIRPESSASSGESCCKESIIEVPAPHKHKPARSMNMTGIFIHIIGDALGNLGVIVTGLIILLCKGQWRYYMDPTMSVLISLMIFAIGTPLIKKASHILLQGVPSNVSLSELRTELELRREIKNVEKLHVWQLSEQVTIASVHVVVDARTEDSIVVPIVREILATQGIQFSTIEVAKEDNRGKEFRISSLHFSNHGGDWVRVKDWRLKGSTLPDTVEERDATEIMM